MRTVWLLSALGAVALVASACGGDHGHTEASDVPDGARTIEMTGDQFRFSPDRITVSEGEGVAIRLTSEDLEHDFVIDEFDAHVGAKAGETATGGFTASRAGTYTFYCSVPGHREAGMTGTLEVMPRS